MSFEELKEKIKGIISGSKVPEDPIHAEKTLGEVLRLRPEASEALRIAALGHDIERAIEERKVRREDYGIYEEFKKEHALNSARILREVMEESGYEKKAIKEVEYLVERHEGRGVSLESDLGVLIEADGLSFFKYNLGFYFEREGEKEVLRRMEWGYRRLSEKGKEIVKRIRYEGELGKLMEKFKKF